MRQKYNDASRYDRLTRIQYHLHKKPLGLTSRELASLCDTTIRTIQRDLLVLQSDLHIPMEKKSFDRWVISQDYFLPPVSYSLYEALVLFLAARLMVRQTDEANPHIQSALDKLLSNMPAPLALQLKKSVETLGRKPLNPAALDVFEKVSLAWVTQKRLRIVYHSFHRRREEQWHIDPYFMEMTGVGYSLYLIGYAESGERMGIYTFKLNRIREIEILNEDFNVTHDLKMDELLGSSWGVIWGEETQVVLKFSAAVAARVKETNWHPSQVIEDLQDGGCLLRIKVSSTLEMTPWIRGWGSDVEVLEPLELRTKFQQWSKQLEQMYNMG
jgi:predicted DNA-binding transcriptional regulator YafY